MPHRAQQDQFLTAIDRDEAERRFHAALRLEPLGEEEIPLDAALGRVLSRDFASAVDVPLFDRSNVDGFAVRSVDTLGATEETPRKLRLLHEILATGVVPTTSVGSGEAITIATGGMLPRGADAVVMVEHTEVRDPNLVVYKPVAPAAAISFAGSDITSGEMVLFRNDVLTSRETGVLAAIGIARVWVWRQPRVAIISTGDEIIAPGQPPGPALVYDSNAQVLADAVREQGAIALRLGIVRDDQQALSAMLKHALEAADVVLLSGGTSKGAGDLCYRVVERLTEPGIVAHGVALKPGKPICLAVERSKPVVILPGFPTSAIFTFHEFVAPVLRRLAGLPATIASTVTARVAMRINSEIGRTEYVLVGLTEDESGVVAFPMGKGSGSVTAMSRADGFIAIPRHREILDAGADVEVQLLGRNLRMADLVVMGSHCLGIDILLSELARRGWHTKFMAIGSTAGLQAVARGECDLAGIHLLDAASGQYNTPFLTGDMELVPGYGRLQGVLFRRGDARFEGKDAAAAVAQVRDDPNCLMINRNQGSGTRILIDQLLAGARPSGYAMATRSHAAVAAAVAQGRADWGLAVEYVARRAELGFLPLKHEQYDFVIADSRKNRPAVAAWHEVLSDPAVRERLASELGLVMEVARS